MEQKQEYLRPVELSDALLLYNWRNDEAVRRNSFHSERLVYTDHERWLTKILDGIPPINFYILMYRDIPIGQIRMDREDNAVGLITYSKDSLYRSSGYGKKILDLFEKEIGAESGITLVGCVKKENLASQKVFEALGYDRKDEGTFFRYEKYMN